MMPWPSAKAWLLAVLTSSFATKALGSGSANSSTGAVANYTEQLLSSGTIELGEWQDAYDKAKAFVDGLTTDEKLSLITGGDAGNFTALNMLDSATNPLKYYYVTTWPAGLAMAMTWDSDAAQSQGHSVGSEFKAKGVNLAYGPTLEPLGRSAWCGRTGETYGVDSYHSGIMAGAVTKGMAASGIVPSAKHFIMNEFETNRMASGDDDAYSVAIGDKAFHETYLAPFYDTVKNGMGGAMCSMNRINGTYSCENQEVLAKVLKVELGFPGLVVADASAQQTGLNAANAGMDISSSRYWSNDTLISAMSNGTFTPERLDDMAIRNLMGYYRTGQDGGYPTLAGVTDRRDVRGNHSTLARRFAAQSVALLKNTNDGVRGLPLTGKTSISIFGSHAAPRFVGPNTALAVYNGEPDTMSGHMATVGGSAMGSMAYLTTPVQLMANRAASDGFMLRWWLNDTVEVSDAGRGEPANSGTELEETTTGVAADSDVCIVFLNAWGGEGADRSELANARQDELVNTVADNCNNTIVVINTIGPRLVDAWVDHGNVTGILYAGALGQESGNAIDDVLFGEVNPSGRLVHTIARNETDYNANTRVSDTDRYLSFDDGNYVDYKWFDKYNITPRYEFGYGLSYTTFEYSSKATVELSENITSGVATGRRAVGGRKDLWNVVATVKSSVSNTGIRSGAEVVQLYVAFPEAAGEPARQLRGFQKVTVRPGESADVAFSLRRRDLSVWDVGAQEWSVVAGDYTFYVGASSRDFRASATLTVL